MQIVAVDILHLRPLLLCCSIVSPSIASSSSTSKTSHQKNKVGFPEVLKLISNYLALTVAAVSYFWCLFICLTKLGEEYFE